MLSLFFSLHPTDVGKRKPPKIIRKKAHAIDRRGSAKKYKTLPSRFPIVYLEYIRAISCHSAATSSKPYVIYNFTCFFFCFFNYRLITKACRLCPRFHKKWYCKSRLARVSDRERYRSVSFLSGQSHFRTLLECWVWRLYEYNMMGMHHTIQALDLTWFSYYLGHVILIISL